MLATPDTLTAACVRYQLYYPATCGPKGTSSAAARAAVLFPVGTLIRQSIIAVPSSKYLQRPQFTAGPRIKSGGMTGTFDRLPQATILEIMNGFGRHIWLQGPSLESQGLDTLYLLAVERRGVRQVSSTSQPHGMATGPCSLTSP